MELLQLREAIDQIDKDIVALYEKRMEIAEEVAKFKIDTGKKVFDKEREKEKLEAVKAFTHNTFNAFGVQELFEQIMSMSRKLQYQVLGQYGLVEPLPFTEVSSLEGNDTRVVFQGAEGAYSQAAMERYFGNLITSFHVDTFREAMYVIAEGRADFAVLPIENSSAGIVNETYDLLVNFENYIVGEQILKIEHCLMGVKGSHNEEIKTVFSHPQSLMQCSQYLGEHSDIKQISMQNNAFAAQKILEDNNISQGAIAGAYAAKVYGLEILEKGIQNNNQNATRFIIVTNRPIFLNTARKVSICFEIPHERGSLYHILSHFIYNNLNMNKIESRPIEGKNWEYRFFVDFEGNLADSAVKNALRGLREEVKNMKILGNY